MRCPEVASITSFAKEVVVAGFRRWRMVVVFVLGLVLVLTGLLVVEGSAGSILLAVGLILAFGAGLRLVTKGDSGPPDERRVPAGHSGV